MQTDLQRNAQALVAAVRIAQPRLDAAMAAEAEAALAKILSVLPTDARAAAESLALFAPDAGIAPEVRDALQAMRRAVLDRPSGKVDAFRATNAPCERLDNAWIARAANSLPVPLCPSKSTC